MAKHKSIIFAHAAANWHAMSSEYDAAVEADYGQALNHCSGVLLNSLGLAKDVESQSLFTGTEQRAYLYASDELVRYWDENPRVSKAVFERSWAQGRGLL